MKYCFSFLRVETWISLCLAWRRYFARRRIIIIVHGRI